MIDFKTEVDRLNGDNLIHSLTQEIYAMVKTKENEACIKAIREYAKSKNNVTLLTIEEDVLLRILELGMAAYKKEQEN